MPRDQVTFVAVGRCPTPNHMRWVHKNVCDQDLVMHMRWAASVNSKSDVTLCRKNASMLLVDEFIHHDPGDSQGCPRHFWMPLTSLEPIKNITSRFHVPSPSENSKPFVTFSKISI